MSERFETTYFCTNCGDEWEESQPVRTLVRDSTSVENVRVLDKDCDSFGMINCECCYEVGCPTCCLKGDVTVDSRQPIVGGEEE